MKRAIKRYKAIIFIIVFVSIGVAAAFFRYNQEGFTGNRVKNQDSYLLEIERMNGTDLHSLDLQTGDILMIQFETLKGSLYLEIKAPDGSAIYRGNGKETTDFTVDITESGVYTIVVCARHAKGSIQIDIKNEHLEQ